MRKENYYTMYIYWNGYGFGCLGVPPKDQHFETQLKCSALTESHWYSQRAGPELKSDNCV